MRSNPGVGQTISDEIVQAIRDFGPVVGIEVEGGDRIGSAERIEQVLHRASRNADPAVATIAGNAIAAIDAFGRKFGTPWEHESPGSFAALRTHVRTVLTNLLDYVQAK